MQPTAVLKERRWLALAFVALAQLMIALDATIMSVALPSAQRALAVSDADRQWVVTAYTLAFGGLLLLGGKVVDSFGRRRSFLAGLAGFGLASALGGWAPNLAVLVAARSLQGAFAALLAPTALSVLTVMFTEPAERAKAFAIFGAIAGSGAAAGMLLGGALTQYLSWRWCLYVNIPIALVAAAGILASSSHEQEEGRERRGRFDVAGAVLVTTGLTALVYACSRAVSDGWASTTVLGLLGASVVLLAFFVWREAVASEPLLPLRILLDSNRGGAYLAATSTVAGIFGAFLFLTYFLQQVLGYTPLETGLAFLPVTVASQAASWLIARPLLPRLQPRILMAPGALVAAAGMVLLTQLHAGAGSFMLLLPAEVLLGAGTACVMVAAFSVGTLGVERRLAGAAAATVTTAQQVGGSLGVALLNAVLVGGYPAASAAGAAILLAGAVVSWLLIKRPLRAPSTP
jgi:EmrB/QacA subfamily drug resistance transporter